MLPSSCFNAYVFYTLIFAEHLVQVSGSIQRRLGTTGCGTPHAVDGSSKDFEILTNGGNRTYRIHLPSSYDQNTAAPLLISYHGHGKDMVQQETLSQFSNDAFNSDMIAVYPQGLKGAVSRAFIYPPDISHIVSTLRNEQQGSLISDQERQ